MFHIVQLTLIHSPVKFSPSVFIVISSYLQYTLSKPYSSLCQLFLLPFQSQASFWPRTSHPSLPNNFSQAHWPCSSLSNGQWNIKTAYNLCVLLTIHNIIHSIYPEEPHTVLEYFLFSTASKSIKDALQMWVLDQIIFPLSWGTKGQMNGSTSTRLEIHEKKMSKANLPATSVDKYIHWI